MLAGWPEYVGLAMPVHGYVSQPVPLLTYAPELCRGQPCVSYTERMAALGGRDFITPDQVELGDFDLAYYSIPE